MKRLRDRLNNKKGFTLVELIVVIVIILILAAVLVPNVMRYIGQARESAFQNEASAYMTELQGYAAECYGKTDKDIPTGSSMPTEYPLTDFSGGSITIQNNADGALTTVTYPVNAVGSAKTIQANIYHGSVTQFTYQDTNHYISWEQAKGWTDVDKNSWPSPSDTP